MHSPRFLGLPVNLVRAVKISPLGKETDINVASSSTSPAIHCVLGCVSVCQNGIYNVMLCSGRTACVISTCKKT